MAFKTTATYGKIGKPVTSTELKNARVAITELPSDVRVLAARRSGDTTVAKVQDKGQVFEVQSAVLMTSEGSVVGYAQVYTILNGIQPDAGIPVTKSGTPYRRYQLSHPMNSTEWSVEVISAASGVEYHTDVTKTTTQVVIDIASNPTENYHVTLIGYKV